jgi:alkanesulfonate monooxygenase SsuD/methylene tetrahydromethanopterin reductase-like flavin-dependent oxidoreductase (luciferase family)
LGVGTFISVGRSLDTALQRVELAERLGYESVWVNHLAGYDSLSILMAYATRTERVKLGTGVLPTYSRTPVATAQAAVTVDEYSGGRHILGIGVSHRPVVEGWYGSHIDKPVREMREYASLLRAFFRREEPPQGERFQSHFQFMGVEPRADLPIYIAALSPGMLRLAGELADGSVLWLSTRTTSAGSWSPKSRRAASERASPSRASTSSRPCRWRSPTSRTRRGSGCARTSCPTSTCPSTGR